GQLFWPPGRSFRPAGEEGTRRSLLSRISGKFFRRLRNSFGGRRNFSAARNVSRKTRETSRAPEKFRESPEKLFVRPEMFRVRPEKFGARPGKLLSGLKSFASHRRNFSAARRVSRATGETSQAARRVSRVTRKTSQPPEKFRESPERLLSHPKSFASHPKNFSAGREVWRETEKLSLAAGMTPDSDASVPSGSWPRGFTCRSPVRKGPRRSCAPRHLKSRCVAVSPLWRRWLGWSTANETLPLASDGTRTGGDGAAGRPASPDDDLLTDGIPRQTAKPVAPPISQDERYRIGQAAACLGLRAALAVGSWNLRTVGYIPFAIPFEDCCELVSHLRLSFTAFHLGRLLRCGHISSVPDRPLALHHPPPHHRQPSLQVLPLWMRERHR